MKKTLVLIVGGFCVLCGVLVWRSGAFVRPGVGGSLLLLAQAAEAEAPAGGTADANDAGGGDAPKLEASTTGRIRAVGGPGRTVVLGSTDPNSGFKYAVELNSKGAALERATFSEFNDRNRMDPRPLDFLRPVEIGRTPVMSMANRGLVLLDENLQLGLDALNWRALDAESADGAAFEALIRDGQGREIVRLVKTYEVVRDSYLMNCTLALENLDGQARRLRVFMGGPVGPGREEFRTDARSAVAGFRGSDGALMSVRRDIKKLRKGDLKHRRLISDVAGAKLLWVAATNKYFAAIAVPLPEAGAEYAEWLVERAGRAYNPDGDDKFNTGDETMGVDLRLADVELAAAGQDGSARTYAFELYLGPKDKSLFDKDPRYRELGFVETIDFMACCCPASIIRPLAFGILWLMKVMYGVIGNYGVVIIIFVFIVRALLHPITKHSQVQMSKFSKLQPKMEEIKKKYANNKAEMQKQMVELTREGGAAPIMGMLPMFVQMPIWIALYSAIYASIDLRGAAFLPFWITDLSMPDALITWSPVTVPLLDWRISSLNVLPLLMGVAFYLQQKLMPSQSAQASTNPQIAQQQKMMMIMMPIMFPLMLYTAPSGLNLYIMASTFAGVIEQYFIRKHIRQREEAEADGKVAVTAKTGGKLKKKKPKPFFKY